MKKDLQTRETVHLPEDVDMTYEIIHGSRNSDWEWISEKTMGIDLDKGIEDIEVILQRKSDAKYFKFSYSGTNYHSLNDAGLNEWPLKGKEVFPKQVTITTYE